MKTFIFKTIGGVAEIKIAYDIGLPLVSGVKQVLMLCQWTI
jgi:hypothetical protein